MLRGEDRSYLVRHDDGGLAGHRDPERRAPRLRATLGLGARVTDIMTRHADLATIGPDAPLVDALRLIQEREVGQLPVVEEDGARPGRHGHPARHPAPHRRPHEARALSDRC